MKKIIKVNYGLASSYDDFIEINKKLKGSLKRKIIDHEKRHTSGFYSKQDYFNDFNSKDSYFLESLKFCMKNPEGFINFFPVMYSYYSKSWTFNTSSIIPVIYFGSLFSLVFFALFDINLLMSFMTFLIIIILINKFLLIYTHFYVINH